MPISIVIFLLISTIIHGEEIFDCTGYEDDSYHPIFDADDCRHYWHCIYVNTVYMHAVRRACPAGTEFHVGLRQCETASEVDCVPVRSPHMPRTTSTTQAWKWRYSKLFSRLNLKPTVPYFLTTRRHPIFDLGDSSDIATSTMIAPEVETTEQMQVLPFTLSEPTTIFSLEHLSKNLHALLNHPNHLSKSKISQAKFFQPGEPENEADLYTSTTNRRTRRTRYTTQSTSIQTTTFFPLTTLLVTTETTTTTSTSTTLLAITSADTSTLTATSITTLITEADTTMNINPQPRMSGGSSRYRRNNMTLYILTSDEHRIRQFSVNHTRGILINCNQLRRRLLGRRRLRDAPQLTSTTQNSLLFNNSSIQISQCNILLLTIFSLIFFTKIILLIT